MYEEKIQNLIEQFIDDLTAGREPEIYRILAGESELRAEIEPILELIKTLRGAPLPIPAAREAKMLADIFEDARTPKQD